MAIDIGQEEIISLTEATKVMPQVNGKRPAISTLWRWCRKGVRGVYLEYVRVGRNIATSREAMGRFFVALAESDPPLPSTMVGISKKLPPATPKSRQRAIEAAERRMAKAGI